MKLSFWIIWLAAILKIHIFLFSIFFLIFGLFIFLLLNFWYLFIFFLSEGTDCRVAVGSWSLLWSEGSRSVKQKRIWCVQRWCSLINISSHRLIVLVCCCEISVAPPHSQKERKKKNGRLVKLKAVYNSNIWKTLACYLTMTKVNSSGWLNMGEELRTNLEFAAGIRLIPSEHRSRFAA